MDLLASAGGAFEVAGLKADGELAALAEAAALKIEGDGNGGDAGAEVLRAEFYGDAEELVARGGGEGFEAGFLRRRHAEAGVSKGEDSRRGAEAQRDEKQNARPGKASGRAFAGWRGDRAGWGYQSLTMRAMVPSVRPAVAPNITSREAMSERVDLSEYTL